MNRVSLLSSAIRRASFMGAAATALVAGAPLLYSRAVAAEITTVNAAQATTTAESGQVQDLMSVPLEGSMAPASEPVISLAIDDSATGSDNLIVNNDTTVSDGVVLDGEIGDITFNNSGDISGGIDVNTGKFREEDSEIVVDHTVEVGRYVVDIGYDADQGGWMSNVIKAKRYDTFNYGLHDANSNDATIRIQNDGSVRFTGERGINAKNESGSLIEITNTGDIISEGGTDGAVGIFADTTNQAMPWSSDLVDSVVVPGTYEYVYAPDWQGNPTIRALHKVIEQGYQHYTYQVSGLWKDRGDIVISNAGNIDLGADSRDTTGILTASPGKTFIDNSGEITVGYGRFAKGIQSYVQGETTVYNSGSINFKNGGTGIDVRTDPNVGTQLDDFFNSGDMLIVNTGDITGGVTREEFLAQDAEYIYNNSDWSGSPEIDATGMFGYSFGSNGKGNTPVFKWRYDLIIDSYERYGMELPTEGPLFDFLERNKLYSEGVETYETTLINAGNITLGDGAVGVKGASLFGELNLINTGTISVGDGATDIDNDRGSDFSAGMSSHRHYGSNSSMYADIYMLNEAGGIITTGDDAIGMAGYIQAGTLEMVNRGDITVGDGLAWEQVYYGWSGTYNQTYFAPSYGMRAQQPDFALYFTQTMTAYNGGNITTGDMSHGIAVSRMTRAVDYYPEEYDANAINTGSVTTGNNSTGISIHSISDGLVVNTGDITIGSRDDAQFDAISEQNFPNTGALNQGIRVRSQYASYVVNDGAVTTGDGTAGVYSRVNRINGQTSVLLNGENGSITTGDASTGVFMMGGGYAAFENAGSITVGDDSIAVDTRFFGFADHYNTYAPLTVGYGGASIVNSGDIVAGNASIGVSMSGTYQQGFACAYDPYGWSSCDDSALQDTQLVGVASLVNRGNIVVGDGSTAVEMSGIGNIYNGYQLPQLVNYGEISAGDNGIAIKINTADMLAFGGDKVVADFPGNNWQSDSGFGRGRYDAYSDLPPASEIAIDSTVVNYGLIDGHVLFGAGNDTLINARNETQVGTIVMNDSVIDFDAGGYGAGTYDFLSNSGLITVSGDNNLINAVSGIYNAGEIRGDDGAVLRIEGNAGLGVSVGNYGIISSGLLFGDGDDLLVNSSYGGSPGTVIMNNSAIDFGGGNNVFYNLGGTILVESGDNRITGATVVMSGGQIIAIDDQANSSLTIDGDVLGDFVFATDIATGSADRLVINGDVGEGSAIGVVINPTEQMSGQVGFGTLIKVGGENYAGDVELLGVSGNFADTLLDARIHMREDGSAALSGIFGMGHLSTATTAATSMLQNYWMQSVSSFDQRNSRWLSGSREGGISVWGGGYHNEGYIKAHNARQNTHFDQLMSGTQFGLTYTATIGGATLAVGPNFSQGQGRASMNANTATASADALSYGINASVNFDSRFYLDAAWQRADMDFSLATPNSAMPTNASTEGSSTGFNLEAGYRYLFESGLGLSPQLQYATVDADLDDFTSPEGLYRHTEVGGKASRVRAGVSLFKTITSPNGHITPLINLSYVNATDGESRLKANDVSFENTTTGAGYDLGLGLSGRYHDWDIGVRLGIGETEATGVNLSTNVNVRYRW